MTVNNHSTFWGIARKKFIPGIAWFLLVLILICTPGEDLPKVDNWLIEIDFDKFIHVGIFGVLAFLFMHPFSKSSLPNKQKWQYCIKIAIATCIWGYATELLQKYFIPGRSYDLMDWVSDSVGGLVALLICKKFFLTDR
ncbi:MAG: VanZ family protein [Ferruginibacter sp.]